MIWATFAALLCAAGVRFSFGALIKPWETEFGWTRDTVSFVGSLVLLVYGFVPPFAGRLADSRGARLVLVAGVLLAGASAILTSFITQLWQLAFTFGLLAGMGAAFGSAVPAVPLAARWFSRRRGLAVGITTSGTAAAQVAVVPLVIYLIVSSGWRAALLGLGAFYIVVMAPLLFFLIRSRPEDMGLQPYGASRDAGVAARLAAEDEQRTPLTVAMRTRPYWMLALGYFVCGFTTLGLISTHLVPYTVGDLHLTEGNAAQALAVLGVFDVAGTIFAGIVSDRLGRVLPLGTAYLLRAVSYFVLMNVASPVVLVIWGGVYGLTELATVPLVAQLTGDLFGRRSLGTIYGSIFMCHQVGAAFGAAFGGLIFRQFGSYHPALMTGLVMLLFAAAMSYSIRERPRTLTAKPSPA